MERPQVAEALDVAEGTVFRTKRRFAEEGLEGVLKDRPQAHRYRKLDERGAAHLIALAGSPSRRKDDEHWTLRLAGGQSGGVGVGAVVVPRDGAAAPEKNALKPPFCNGAGCGRSRSGAFPG